MPVPEPAAGAEEEEGVVAALAAPSHAETIEALKAILPYLPHDFLAKHMDEIPAPGGRVVNGVARGACSPPI